MSEDRPASLLVVAGLAGLQSLLRIVFFYMGTFGGAQLISPPPPDPVMEFINAFSLGLGVAGLLAVPGLVFSRSWGYWGMVTVCVVTVGFDLWAFSTTASTAAAGLVVPAIALVYLVPRRQNLSHRHPALTG